MQVKHFSASSVFTPTRFVASFLVKLSHHGRAPRANGHDQLRILVHSAAITWDSPRRLANPILSICCNHVVQSLLYDWLIPTVLLLLFPNRRTDPCYGSKTAIVRCCRKSHVFLRVRHLFNSVLLGGSWEALLLLLSLPKGMLRFLRGHV